MKKYLTSESVCEGHPDKLCDYISDSILDACLRVDEFSRVACEVMATKGKIIVAGEITCEGPVYIDRVVTDALLEREYDPLDFEVSIFIHTQSPDIAEGVDKALEIRESMAGEDLGAGDQGTVYGYATNETSSYLPLPLELAHRICASLDGARQVGTLPYLKSDGKAQVSIEYEDDNPIRVAAVIVSVQHDASKDLNELRKEITSQILYPVFDDVLLDYCISDEIAQILINPSGRFVEGGPAADTGLTGRKLMVDTYGGLELHGGGAFSGKDPTKVDRSGAYMARFIAKNIVAAGLAARCEVALSYAIGKAEPVAVNVTTFTTGTVGDETLTQAVKKAFPLKPQAIIDTFNLRTPIYSQTSCYGHFGSTRFPWERPSEYFIAALKGILEHAH